MSENPQTALERLISEGQNLLERYIEAKSAQKNPNAELSDTFWSEIAGALVGGIFESGRVGSQTRKLTKSTMQSGRRIKLSEINKQFQSLATTWIKRVHDLLKGISTKDVRVPNSQKLLSRFSRIERYVRPDTKIRNGMSIIREFILQGVVRNEELAKSRTKGLIAIPGEQFKAFNRIIEIIAKSVGYLIVVDSYPGHDTLVAIENSPINQSVKFLTNPPNKPKKRSQFEVLARKLMIDRKEIEIRYAPAQTLHDRFIITKREAWHIGHSIKDIGNKLSAVTIMGSEEKKRLEEEFNSLWKQAISV